MFGSPGLPEILIVILVILLFFGAKRIPELARGIGQGIKEFRKASDEIKKEIEEGEKEGFDGQKKENTQKKQQD